ncbi:MAG: hypothetical protein MUE60_07810 [Candidatus Eisenbacteria bacterium]|nr:hypothetical protein [Candidatus Eisenbacteria bacterium]
MRRHFMMLLATASMACLLPTPRERAMEEPDPFDRFNALAELDSTTQYEGCHPVSDPVAVLPGSAARPGPHAGDLRLRAPDVRRYLASVNRSLCLKGIVPGDGAETAPWEAQFDAQTTSESFSGWSVELWAAPRIDGRVVAQQIRCDIIGIGQLPLATVAPTLSIKEPAHGLRFDWFVATGDSLRDEEILGTIRARALTF